MSQITEIFPDKTTLQEQNIESPITTYQPDIEDVEIESNAFLIITKAPLSESTKKELKSRFGCHWFDGEDNSGWSAPLEKSALIEAFLKVNDIQYTGLKICDGWHDKSKDDKKIEQYSIATDFVRRDISTQVIEFNALLADYNKRYEANLKLKDFIGATEDGLLNSTSTNDLRQIDLLKILFKEYLKINENSQKERLYGEKISNLKTRTLTLDDVLKCLLRNERGDAELFLLLHREKYLFDGSEGRGGEFYYWTGTNWELDQSKQRYRDMEAVSKCYEEASFEIVKGKETSKEAAKEAAAIQEQLCKRAFALRSSKRCKSVLEFVATEIPFTGEWDRCPGKLPCKNGVVDLKTGNLENHRPDFYIRSICPTAYNASAPRPLFNQFVDDITLGKVELKDFLGRILGAALLGDSKEEKVFIFHGEDGRNGKGTLMQTLERVLGNLAKTFPSEMLLLQRNPPSSSTPRPEKANLQGVRFAIFSEINKGRKIDASEVKNLSGRDTITCRRLFSNRDVQIQPTHTMIIQTNYKPEAPSDDNALWKRNVLVPFNAEFVEEPKLPHQRKLDEGFKGKLLSEREGILAWLIESCLEYQKKGLCIPDIVRLGTEAYRRENDGIAAFVADRCIIDPLFSTPCSKMQKAIKDFCKEEGYNAPNLQEIAKALDAKFPRKKENSGRFYTGISIAPQEKAASE